LDLTKIEEAERRNKLLRIDLLFKEYVCLYLSINYRGSKNGFSISPSAIEPNLTSEIIPISSLPLLAYTRDCEIKSETTEFGTSSDET
jgi:hypothetical protein